LQLGRSVLVLVCGEFGAVFSGITDSLNRCQDVDHPCLSRLASLVIVIIKCSELDANHH